jgi:DNA-binding SARP family transcriptional activator
MAAEQSDVAPEKLISILETSSARAPHNTQMLAHLGRAYAVMGESSKARDYYERIILVSDNPEERLWAQKQADSGWLRQN